MNEEKETGRIEAFSDGVFAIAVTLLVLDIKVPRIHDLPPGARLLPALLQQWPTYFAYVTSFLTILVMWVNHHKLFTTIRRTDHWFLLINGLLLMGITIVPFPTALLAEYIQHRDATVAAAVFSGTYVVIALLFNLLWRYAVYKDRLLGRHKDKDFIRNISWQYAMGPLLYVVTFLLAFVNVTASVVLNFLFALFFALPTATSASRPRS
jgi:uncharacterized membrane protein